MNKRRTVLKTIPIVAASSVVWKKPVIESVLLPSHAQVSGGFFADGASATLVGPLEETLWNDPFNIFIRTAHADHSNDPATLRFWINAIPIGNGDYEVTVNANNRATIRRGILNSNGVKGSLTSIQTCRPPTPGPMMVRIDSINSMMALHIDRPETSQIVEVLLSPGTTTIPPVDPGACV